MLPKSIIPKKIQFNSDGNILTYTGELQPGKERYHIFRYTKSLTKKDQLLGLTEQEIISKLSNKIISIL